MIEHIHQDLTVPRENHGQRIDAVVAQLLPQYSRSIISTWIKAGHLTHNSKVCKPKDKALEGDRIVLDVDFQTIDTQFNTCEPEDIPLNLVYEDEALLVINKPVGLVVHPGAGNREHTLVNALLHHCPDLQHLPRAGIIHRLDKDTTGLLIVAKTLTAHTALIRQMQAREIDRHYLALVHGHLISSGTIETEFGRHPRNRLKMAVVAQGKEAITHYSINKHYGMFTLLNIHLMTGRTHQIRVHMEHINHPIVGDPLYSGRMRFPAGASEELREVLNQFNRQALHARHLAFLHPETEEELTFNAAIPDDFAFLINTLDRIDDNK